MRRNVKVLALIMTLIMALSAVAVVLAVNTSAITKTNDYLVISGSEMAGAGEIWGITTKSTANGVWSFTTDNNDPYVNLASMANVGDTILRTYPYMVVRYKTSQFTSMEIFCGHPGVAHRRVSMPAPATNGQWGCLFYDFSPFPDPYRSWFRLEVATASGINMEIAEVVLFKNVADVTNYHSVYSKAGSSTTPTVLTFNDWGFHGGNTGRNESSGSVSSITEVRPDNQEAMFNEGGYFTRLTSHSADGWVAFKQANTDISSGIKNFKKIAVRYRAPSSVNGQIMQIFFGYDSGNWSEGNSVQVTVNGDDSWQWAFFTKPTNRSYDSIRFDYISGVGHIDIAEVYFYNDDADIYNAQVGMYCRRNGGTTWFHSGMYMLHKDSNTYFQSVGTVSGGTLAGKHRSATGASFDYGTTTVTTVGRTFCIKEGTHSAHNESTTTVVSTPTCTASGSTKHSCSLCGELQRTSTQAAKGHTNKTLAAVPATCTATGLTEGKQCTVCNVVTTAQQTTAKLPHTEAIDAAVAATCTTTGLTQGCHCSVCQTVITAQTVTQALGHNEVTDSAVDPDCTNTGLTAGKHCDRCHEILVKQNVVNALGHAMVSVPKVAPTYTTVGHEVGSTCSRCTEATVQGAEIPKLNPLITYNVALGEKFAVNVKYVAFSGVNISTSGTCSSTLTDETDAFGNPIAILTISDVSAKEVGTTFTVTETASGYSTVVSVAGYCDQLDTLYAGKTAEDLTAQYVSAGMNANDAAAKANKDLLAYDTTKSISLYGQAAQNYFNQDAADHAALADKVQAYVPTNTSKTVSNTGRVVFKGASVVFGDEVELLFKMENYNNEQIYVNGVLVPENEIKSRLSTDGTYVYFSILVTPANYSTSYTVRAGSIEAGDLIPEDSEDYNGFEGDYYTGASTVTYSVDTYIASMQAKYAGDSSNKGLATLNLINALGSYGLAASAYAAA